MPEICLKYGLTGIALDMKFGNLVYMSYNNFREGYCRHVREMPMSNNMLIFALSRSKPLQRVTQMLQHVIQSMGFERVDNWPKIVDRFSEGHDFPFFLAKRYEKNLL